VAGSDGLILVPQQTIWYQRLRSFNALGNPNFECDNRLVNAAFTYGAGSIGQIQADRWQVGKVAATGTMTGLTGVTAAGILVPGTNFRITRSYIQLTVGTAQATLAAGEYVISYQFVEGPRWRELASDVHSVSILCYCSIALNFTLFIRDSTNAYSLVIPVSIPAATVTLVTLPNLPLWTSSGNFNQTPGALGYNIGICLGCGTTFQTGTTGSWVAGSFLGYAGMSNFLATAGAIFQLRFMQHEPGALCSTLMDIDFPSNLLACERYYQKTYDYATAVASAVNPGMVSGVGIGTQVQIRGGVSFRQRMAKVPTVTTYNVIAPIVANQVTQIGGGGLAAGTTGNVGETGYALNLSAAPTASATYQWQHVADTGW
jgi:hypothetical protein